MTQLLCGEQGSKGHFRETSEVATVPVQAGGGSWTREGSGGRGQRAEYAWVLLMGGMRV